MSVGEQDADWFESLLAYDLVPTEARFHPVHVDPTYSRYRRVGDTAMDDSFFPVVWTRDGGRSAWLDAEVAENVGGVLTESGH